MIGHSESMARYERDCNGSTPPSNSICPPQLDRLEYRCAKEFSVTAFDSRRLCCLCRRAEILSATIRNL